MENEQHGRENRVQVRQMSHGDDDNNIVIIIGRGALSSMIMISGAETLAYVGIIVGR